MRQDQEQNQKSPSRAVIVKPGRLPTVARLMGYQQIREMVGGKLEAIQVGSNAIAYILAADAEPDTADGALVNHAGRALLEDLSVRLEPGDVVRGTLVIFGTLSPDGEFDGEDWDAPRRVVEAAVSLASRLSQGRERWKYRRLGHRQEAGCGE